MSNIENIRKKLIKANAYVIIPETHISVPLPMPEWEVQGYGENGELVGTNSYYSLQTLSDELGKLLVPVKWVDERFVCFRYGFDWDTVDDVDDYLESIGLKHIRKTTKNNKKAWKKAEELDYTVLDGTEFIIIPTYMIDDVPEYVPTEEEEVL